jgi:hypothetical protein
VTGNDGVVGNGWETESDGCYSSFVSQPLPLDEALKALKRDPTQPVCARVDDELTVEVRAVSDEGARKKTVGDLLREIGRWEGETGADLDALFVRQRGNRRVPDLP